MLHFADVIDYEYITIAADTAVEDAISQLDQSKHGALMVITSTPEQNLVGIFTNRDVVRLLTSKMALQGVQVQAIIDRSLPVVQTYALEHIPSILALFQQYQVAVLPVVTQQGTPIGWVSSQKLLQVFYQKQAEETARFRPLFEQAAVGVAQVSLDGKWLLVNQALCRMLGYTIEELQSLKEEVVLYSSDIPAIRMYYQTLLTGDAKTYFLEERFVRKDQSVLWVSTSTSLVRNSIGQPQYFIKIVKDISENKQIETALRRQLKRALLLQKVTDAIRSQLDPQQVFEATVTQVGQAFNVNRCLLMHYKATPVPQLAVAAEYVEPGHEPLAFRNFLFRRNHFAAKILAQDDAISSPNVYADPLLQPMAELCQQLGLKSMLTVRTSYQGEPNGTLVLQQCDRFRVWKPNEVQLLESIAAQVGIALAQVRLLNQEKAQRSAIDQQNARLKQEVQRRKHTEVALSRSNAALKAQQEAALDGILMVDEHRNIVSFNHRFCEVWQIPQEWMGQSNSPQLLNGILAQLEQPQEFVERVEHLYTHPNEISHEEIPLKHNRVLERYSAPVVSAQGEYYGRVWFFRDISERKQAERQLEQRQRYLALLVEIQRYLLATNYNKPAYNAILQRLGQTCGADRVYLFENHHSPSQVLLMSQRAEWCAEGIPSEIANPRLQNLAYDDFFPRWANLLSQGETIQGMVADFPANERSVLEPQDIQAILILPLMVNHIFWGFIGFDNCTESRQWTASEVSLLSVAASAISLHQERQQAETALRESINRERATLRLVERMRQTLNLDQIFSSTVEELRQMLRCDRVLIFRFNPDWSGEVVAESCTAPWRPLFQAGVDNLRVPKEICHNPHCHIKTWGSPSLDPEDRPEVDQPKVENRYISVSNIDTTYLSLPYVNFLRRMQAKANLLVPIYRGNCLWGLLAGYQNAHPRNWEMSEVNVIMHASTQLGIALQQAELFKQTQDQSADLEKARDAAEAANRAKSEFLTNISHELRTPLNAILGFTQVMSRDVVHPKHQEYLGIINRSGQHLLKLINDVLEMSKIEAGRHRLNPTNFDFYHLLDKLYEMLSLKALAKNLSLKFLVEPGVSQYLLADEGKLHQVLLNLLGNAIKFTQNGSVTLRVSIAPPLPTTTEPDAPPPEDRSNSMTLQFEVEDSGLGIAVEEVADLFTPFVQTSTGQQSSEGTGLGLAISQKFVQLMGGTIGLSSMPGQGSCFRFSVFVQPGQPLDATIVPSLQQVAHLEPGQPSYRILVVEDHWENQQLLIELLQPVGFEVQVASNGEEGIATWQVWQPDLILMDIRMPLMDGYEAIRQIKALAQGQPPTMIAITSCAFEEDRTAILAIGCDDFISKPFEEEIIFTKLAKHLGARYTYHKNGQSVIKERIVNPENYQVILDALQEMPPTWVNQLKQAAVQGRDSYILELLEQIPPFHAVLRHHLETLTTSFRFDDIIHLTSTPPVT